MAIHRMNDSDFQAELAKIRHQYPQEKPEQSNANGVHTMVGIFANDPTWDDFTRIIEERRERELVEANRIADEAERETVSL